MIRWWTTNKQLRADVARLEEENRGLRQRNQYANGLLTRKDMEIADLRRPIKETALAKGRSLLQDQPGRGASGLSKSLASKPDARQVVRSTHGFSKPRPDDPRPSPYQRSEPDPIGSFLTGAIAGVIVNEIFSNNSSSSSSDSSSSDSGISSGGGGDFGGGGASGSFD